MEMEREKEREQCVHVFMGERETFKVTITPKNVFLYVTVSQQSKSGF